MPHADEVARLAALFAEPARSRMVLALMGGIALTATELALEAGVAPSTASSHLGKLTREGVVAVERQGRHRYFRLANTEVAALVETLAATAHAGAAGPRRRPGPADPALRLARVCYDHLAGERGVWLLDGLREAGLLAGPDGCAVTLEGEAFFAGLGVDLAALARGRRALVRTCLDWSERRHHLGGALGAAVLARLFALGWARRDLDSRTIRFSAQGERRLAGLFAGSAPIAALGPARDG